MIEHLKLNNNTDKHFRQNYLSTNSQVKVLLSSSTSSDDDLEDAVHNALKQ